MFDRPVNSFSHALLLFSYINNRAVCRGNGPNNGSASSFAWPGLKREQTRFVFIINSDRLTELHFPLAVKLTGFLPLRPLDATFYLASKWMKWGRWRRERWRWGTLVLFESRLIPFLFIVVAISMRFFLRHCRQSSSFLRTKINVTFAIANLAGRRPLFFSSSFGGECKLNKNSHRCIK